VPLYLVDDARRDAKLRAGGRIADVAPTMLEMLGIPDEHVDHGAQKLWRRHYGLDAEGIAAAVRRLCEHGADVVVLAVKPQQMREVAAGLKAHLARQLVVTIAAGIRLKDLARWLGGYQRIVRVMPNTPALELAGMSGLCATPAVSSEDRGRAEKVMRAVGTTLWVEREEQMDAITAVSGSGPAYVFYFIEALQQAGVELGLPPADAERMALETFAGAVKLARSSAEDVATLRRRVTSPGGTTERAVNAMDTAGVRSAITQAVRAAAERSRELGDELGRESC